MRSKLLLNPGPTNTAFLTKIKQFLGSDVCHREENFQSKLSEIRYAILGMGKLKGHVSILAGSGTTALEAMITSLCPNGTLVINAGKYGARAEEIFKVYGIEHSVVHSNYSNDLIEDRDTKWVYFVENETSTGENYSLETMVKKYPNAKFFIDSTSAFGASDYGNYNSKIAALSFCSNKCIQSTPGLGIVVWNRDLEVYERTYFTSLSRYKPGSLPFTLPTQSVAALCHASKKLKWKNNKVLFNKRRDKLIKSFRKMGIKTINKNPANSIIAFVHPHMNYQELHDFLAKKGIVIYSGVLGVKNSFRVSTMSVKFDIKFLKIEEAFRDSCLC
tara:strand:- start:1585 stop:2577 length:993 start_codon:yes stop_codon:yes gene_type:complete